MSSFFLREKKKKNMESKKCYVCHKILQFGYNTHKIINRHICHLFGVTYSDSNEMMCKNCININNYFKKYPDGANQENLNK